MCACVYAPLRLTPLSPTPAQVYALAFYLDEAATAPALASFKGRPASELKKDPAMFEAVLAAPVTKSLRLVIHYGKVGGVRPLR